MILKKKAKINLNCLKKKDKQTIYEITVEQKRFVCEYCNWVIGKHTMVFLDRSEAARLLLELDDPPDAGVEDYSGQAAIVWMIVKMAPVVC